MSKIDIAENAVRQKIKYDLGDSNPTEDQIKNAIDAISLLFPMETSEKEYLEKVLQASFQVRMDMGEKVVNEATYHPWLASRKASIDFYYWNRYRKHLEINQGWDSTIVDTLSDVSDEILDLCGDPNVKEPWKRKGLILGDIQSGKTSNYISLCNKAADAGYKIIILLTGMMEGLRKQTQERIDEGFVGLSSRNMLQKNPERKYIGVGSIDSNRTAFPFTDIVADFSSAKLQSIGFSINNMPEPVVFVLKKNKKVLENLEVWLRTRNIANDGEKIDLPLLFIDDEADNASVNTNKPDEQPTAINGAIVDILKLFNRSSYIAVTATPFANIFIDPELDKGTDEFNLFPSDFIYALSAPSNYIGADSIFKEDGKYADALEPIDDVLLDANNNTYVFRSKARSNHKVPFLPISLRKAIKYFLLINTVMDLNGNTTSHRSMLVNVSQFVRVQSDVFDMISIYLKKYQRKIQGYSKLDFSEAIKCEEIKSLFEVWDEYRLGEKTKYTKEQILENLHEAVAPIQMRLVNGESKGKGIERLDYMPYEDTGLRTIAVGGNSLSRGLTLEGLCVSYFDRNSQMYDTLMQMGRWFGYRKGYEKLFKIWMEPTAMSWYQYIANATQELREEILEMRRVGLTPRDFGLKVQQNMVSLFVTARTKMRATRTVEQWISLAADLVETPRLVAQKEKCLKINLNITNELLKHIENEGGHYCETLNYRPNRLVYNGVDKKVISKYISAFVSHPAHIPFNAKDLSEHILNSEDNPKWTVAVIGGSGKTLEKEYFPKFLVEKDIKYSSRIMRKDDSCLLIQGQRARVGVPGATKFGLTSEVAKQIENEFRSMEDNKEKKTIPDKPYLKIKREPVLLIYLIKIDKEQKASTVRKYNSDKESIDLVGDFPVVGIGLGFPGEYQGASRESCKIKYVLNRVGEQNLLNFDFEEEDIDDDQGC